MDGVDGRVRVEVQSGREDARVNARMQSREVQSPEQNPTRALRRVARCSTRTGIASVLVSGLLLAAASAQALSVDLSGIGSGTTNLDVDGISLTVQSQDYRFVPLEKVSITFNDGPVSLNSVDVLFPDRGGIVLASLMGDTTLISAREAGLVRIDGGGVQGTRIATLSLGRGVQIQKIDFDLISVGGVDVKPRPKPISPIPEPGAALLFSAGLGLVAIRQRASARSSPMSGDDR